jgi:LTXXQ motif family protein
LPQPAYGAGSCRHLDISAELAAHIEREIAPRNDQKLAVQELATALDQADGYLIKSCPTGVPSNPLDRLKLMEAQIDALIMALEIVRPTMQQFEHSLNKQQLAHWNGTQAVENDQLETCLGGNAEAGGWPLAQLEQAIQPTDDQRHVLTCVKDAFDRAASGLAAECSGGIPHPASRRLQYIEGRLDATWRALQTIEIALAGLEKDLSNEQKARFDRLIIVSER